MTYLVDANVLSELTKAAPDAKVLDWLRDHEGEFVVDSIVLGELYVGILSLPRSRKRAQLETWFSAVARQIDAGDPGESRGHG